MPSREFRLTKSRFAAGVQCHKLLWWTVHEPAAPELQPDRVLQDLFDQGKAVGVAARTCFSGGTLIDLPSAARDARIAATKDAIASGASAIFEAAFEHDGVFVAVDVLRRVDDGFELIEVKSSSSQKPEHIADVALQKYVVAANGVNVTGCAVMHLNKENRFPSTDDLFATTDVTAEVDAYLPGVPDELARQRSMVAGDTPEVGIGTHCSDPRDCPFLERCWPQDANHIKMLNQVGPKKADQFMAKGVHWISDIPNTHKLHWRQRRQIQAMRENRLIVSDTLDRELEPFNCTLGFLDFETIARAMPVWPDMGPWHQAAAQYSYHEDRPDGTYAHEEHLAEGPLDARPLLAERMVEATKRAERVVMYTSFERTQIRNLGRAVPHLANELHELEEKLIDLFPVVRDHVYHPDFRGSFSLKYVLTPLVPGLTYSDLIIVDGRVASVEIARLLFVAGKVPPEEHDRVRKDLLDYCERDTWAMVRLLQRLRELAR